jgi:superfamily II DNA or RNA helicase
LTLHSKNVKNIYEYWKCNHTSKYILKNLPITFGEYTWNNKFLDYGYSKITKITKNIKNFNKSKFKRNYVFDLEIEDNHNYIVKNNTHGNCDIQNGFVVHNCHNTASKVFSQILFKLCCKYTIGLSATPKRSDGCEYVFKWHLGDIVYETKSERKGKPPIIRYLKIDSKDYKEIATENKFTGQKQIQFTSMLSDLVDMSKRNGLILDLIKDLIKKDNGRKLLVLSDRRNHLQTINSLLDEDLGITFTYGLFLGGMKQKDLEKGRACQVILATYQAFGEGVSEKDLDTLLLITPKKFIGHLKNTTKNESGKLEQIVGRIFRKDHTERNPLIIDFYDNFSVYKSQAAQRKNFYKQHFSNSINEEWSINLEDVNKGSYIPFIKIKKKKDTKEHDNENDKDLSKSIIQYCILDD